jgi:hypothetical protein
MMVVRRSCATTKLSSSAGQTPTSSVGSDASGPQIRDIRALDAQEIRLILSRSEIEFIPSIMMTYNDEMRARRRSRSGAPPATRSVD